MTDQDFNVDLRPLSKQLNLNAHQTAPQELKSLFKRHSTTFEGEEDELVDLGNIHLPGLESIPPDRAKKAFDALRPRPDTSTSGRAKQLAMMVNFFDQIEDDVEIGGWKEDAISGIGRPVIREEDSPRQAFTFKQIPGKNASSFTFLIC